MMSSCEEEEELYVNMSGQAPAAAPTGGLMKAGYLYKQGKLHYKITTIMYNAKLHETIVHLHFSQPETLHLHVSMNF